MACMGLEGRGTMVYATCLEELPLSLSTMQELASSGMRLSSDAARHGSWWSASSRTYRSALHLYGSHTIEKQHGVNRRHRLLLMRYFVYVEKHRGHEYALLPLQAWIGLVSRIECDTSGSDLGGEGGLQSPCHLKYILDALDTARCLECSAPQKHIKHGPTHGIIGTGC